MLKKCVNFSLFITLIVLLTTAQAAMQTKVINLQYRTAAQMIPVIKPFVAPGGVVTGSQYSLIIKSTPNNIKEIEQIVVSLDKLPKQLLVSVKQGQQASGYHTQGVARVKVYQTQQRDADKTQQSVKVLDGEPAFISVGESIPVVSAVSSNYGANFALSYDYKNVDSGFFVTPRVVSDSEVMLRITRRNDRLSEQGNNRVKTQTVETQMRAPLGQWVQVSGVGQQSSSSQNQVIYQMDNRNQAKNDIYIKVDVVP